MSTGEQTCLCRSQVEPLRRMSFRYDVNRSERSCSAMLLLLCRSSSQVAAYSCQSDKLINSGEGGFLTTNDEELFAKAIYMSGCYEMRYGEKEND